MKKALVCGGAGFIGHHLARRLMESGFYTIVLDLKPPEFCEWETFCNEFHLCDCRKGISAILDKHNFDEVYQLAADMGGAGYIFTGDNDASIMSNSALINIKIINDCVGKVGKIFFSSSACVYPEHNQEDPNNPICTEESVYPAAPDSNYGWEKLFSERLYLSFYKNYKIPVSIGRFHNVYGPECTYDGGKEKVVMALCRKVLLANDSIDVWGNGDQTRSFLYIDDCIDGILAVMRSSEGIPLNIGSEEMISINNLALKVINIVDKKLKINNISGPRGVNGRSSENSLVTKTTGWSPKYSLDDGISLSLKWLKKELRLS